MESDVPKLPFSIETAKPCSESWESMSGDQRSRHCDACRKGVLNLAQMTRREVERVALRAAMGESVCARVTRRDGALVTLPAPPTRMHAAAHGVMLTAALSVGLPVVAQSPTPSDDSEVTLQEVAPQPQAVPGMAVVIGRLLHPDGSRVSSGLVMVHDWQGAMPVYVLDTSGWFEIHLKPGVYDFVLRTGEDQVERVPGAVLHEGVQQFSDLKTRVGLKVPETDEFVVTLGELVSVPVGPKYWLRHPVAYARYVGYRVRRRLARDE